MIWDIHDGQRALPVGKNPYSVLMCRVYCSNRNTTAEVGTTPGITSEILFCCKENAAAMKKLKKCSHHGQN